MQDLQTKSSKIADTVASLKGVPTREELLDLLTHEIVEVTFDKLNGEERIMTCTLRESYLPPANKDEKLSQTRIRNLEEQVIVVWDIRVNGWRSFRYDKLKKVIQITPLGG